MTATINRAAQKARPPLTFDRERLQAEIILATDQPGADGYQLQIRSDLNGIQLPQGRMPILRDHRRETAAQIGWIESIRFERLPQGLSGLVGTARFHPERSADLLDLIEAGAMYWSVSFQVQDSHADTRSGVEVVDRYRLFEVSATPTPLDANAITRSIASVPMTTETSNTSNTETTETVERSAKQIKRERDILRLAQSAQITDPAWIDEMVASDRSMTEIQTDAIRRLRVALEGGDVRTGKVPAIGHPARVHAAPATTRDLGAVLAAKMGCKNSDSSLRQVPISLVLRDYLGSHPEHRGAIDVDRAGITKLVERAWSTSDFSQALESSGERVLLDAYQSAQAGVLALATSRDLPDFRAMEMIRVSQYGEIHEKTQGGEYKTSTFSEENAATLQAAEYGAIAVLTRKALANDDLAIFGQLVSEMGRAAARKERSELAARLTGDFTWGTGNSDTTTSDDADGIIAGITAATLKLRRQTDVDGNAISFEPRLLLVAPEQEAAARQALGTYNPTTASDVMPFPSLQLEVDHYLTDGIFYVSDTSYPQLVVGRIGGGPITSESEDFNTGNRKFRVQSDFGTAVMDQRSICKISVDAG